MRGNPSELSPKEAQAILPQLRENVGRELLLCGELRRVTDAPRLVEKPKALLYRLYSLNEFPDDAPEDDPENYDAIAVEEAYGEKRYELDGDDCVWKE